MTSESPDTILATDDAGYPDELADETIEPEAELEISDLQDIVLYGLDWSVQSILERIGENLDVNPSFQRRDAWSLGRKSSYIESVILGLPVPQIVVAEDPAKKGRFIVLDGKQRLVTLKQFASPNERFKEFKLKGLQFAHDVEGMSFRDMQGSLTATDHAENFLAQPIRTVVVRNWGKPAALYEIFIRLNQNSLPLSPQELRQALFPSDFTFWINERSARSKQLQRARRARSEDFRMRDAEMLLRYIAWFEGMPEYRGNLRQFLDDACERGAARWADGGREHYERLADDCEHAIDRTFEVFGDDAFLRYEDGYNRRFNVAVFDLMTLVLGDPSVDDESIRANASAIKNGFERLCVNDDDFTKSITSTTKSISAVRDRFKKFGRLVQGTIDEDLKILHDVAQLAD